MVPEPQSRRVDWEERRRYEGQLRLFVARAVPDPRIVIVGLRGNWGSVLQLFCGFLFVELSHCAGAFCDVFRFSRHCDNRRALFLLVLRLVRALQLVGFHECLDRSV